PTHMHEHRPLLWLVSWPNHRRTKTGHLRPVGKLNTESQNFLGHFPAPLTWPAAKSSQTVHRIPDFAFKAASCHDTELKSVWKGGQMLDENGGLGRPGKKKAD